MKYVSLALAVGALLTGIIAAAFWYKASIVKSVPKADGRFGGGMATATAPWLAGALDAMTTASRLDKVASLWTAASVVLSGLSSVAGQISN